MHKPSDKANIYSAALYTFIVHALIFEMLFISFNWKQQPQMDVAEVTLWDALPPTKTQSKPEPVVEPIQEKPVEKPVVKEEPVEEKPEVIEKPEEKIDENAIALEKKKAEEKRQADAEKQKKIKEKKEADKKAALEKIQQDLVKDQQQAKAEKKKNDALKKLQADLADESNANAQSVKSSANTSLIGEYKYKIGNKIRANVNKSLCGDGNPELVFVIGLLPTGQLSVTPKLVKSSGNSVCDEAVERAIVASQPLPLPDDKTLYSEFRKITLNFKPNDE